VCRQLTPARLGGRAERCLARSEAGRCRAQPTLLRFARSAPAPGSAGSVRKRRNLGGCAASPAQPPSADATPGAAGPGGGGASRRRSAEEPASAFAAASRAPHGAPAAAQAGCAAQGPAPPASPAAAPSSAVGPADGRGSPGGGVAAPADAAQAGMLAGLRPSAGAVEADAATKGGSGMAADAGACAGQFVTYAVGRGLFPPLAEQPPAGQPLAIQPEPGNPRDANALVVMSAGGPGPGAGLGYLPAVVAAVLAPLLAQGLAAARGVTAEAPASGAAPLRLTLHVRGPCSPSVVRCMPAHRGSAQRCECLVKAPQLCLLQVRFVAPADQEPR